MLSSVAQLANCVLLLLVSVVSVWIIMFQVEEAQKRLHKWEDKKTTEEPLLAGVGNGN